MTGATAVPFFPRTITLPHDAAATPHATPTPALPAGGVPNADEPYQLVGLGVRTVSFLAIKVYVVGLYVATADVATLQARLVRAGAAVEGASTLVAGERDDLRRRLADAQTSEELWNNLLRGADGGGHGGIRSVLRVVPVRSTDLAHLRDGWLRGIRARLTAVDGLHRTVAEDHDGSFATAIATFQQLFSAGGRRNLGTGEAMLLDRNARGALTLWLQQAGDDGPGAKPSDGGFTRMGEVADERVSRLLWLGYLGGKAVASEGARTSIIEGIMELVARPVGTVETQVV